MAMSPDQVHGHQYVDFDEYIDIQLRKTGSTIKTTDVMTAVVGALTLVTLYLLVFVICDHWIVPGGFGPVTRGVMLAVVCSIACVWIVFKVIVPWRRRVSGLYAASTIEKASPALKSSLINLVDISRSGHEVSPEIYQSIERRAALALTHVDVNETVDRRSLLRLSNALLAVVVLFCLYWIFSPKNPGTSLWRAIMPTANVGVATRTEIFNVHPGDKDVLARSQIEVTADIRGEIPQQTFLYFTTADHKFVDERVDMRLENEGTRKFRCVLTGDNGGGILQNMTYRIVAGDAATRDYKIRVIQPPAATIDSIRLDSPEYTHREAVTQTTGPIDALEGTRVTLKAHANMALRSASLQFFDDEAATRRAEEIPIHLTDGTKLEVEWKLAIRSDGTYPHYYRIFCTSTEGESDPSPSLYNLSIRPDLPPGITLRDPKTDLDLPANAILPLVIEAGDPDFALTYIDLNIEKDGSPVIPLSIYSGHDQQIKTTYRWQLKDYQFKPKDTITYWLEAKDNRQPIANVSRTPKLRIHITAPVPEEQVQKQLASAEQRQKQEAQRSEGEQPPQDGKEDNAEDNRNNQQKSKQQKGKNQAGAKQQEKGQRGGANGKPDDEQTDPEQKNDGREQGNSKNDNDQTAQSVNDSPDKNGSQKQRLNPDNPADDAKALHDINDIMQRDHKDSRPNPSQGAGQSDQDKPEKNQPNPDKSNPDKTDQQKPDQNSQQQKQNQKQQGSSADSSQGGQQSQDKQGKAESKQNPSEGSKSENQPNSNEKAGESGNQSRDQKDAKGQSSTPGAEKQDAHGAKPQGAKPSNSNNEGGNSGEKQDGRNQQQQGGERSQQQAGRRNGASEGSSQPKDKRDQKDARGDQSSKTENQPGTPNQDRKPGEQQSQDQKHPDQTGQKTEQSKTNPGKSDQKQEGPQDAKNPSNNQDGSSGSDQPGKNNQQSKDGGQAQNGNQPGDQKANDQGTKDGASQNQNQPQNGDGNSASRKPNEGNAQKPSSDQGSANEPGKKEQGSNQAGNRQPSKQQSDNANERGDASRKEPGEKAGQASRKSERDEKGQPKNGQMGNPNGEQQPQDRKEKGEVASGREAKSVKDRRNERPTNPVDTTTPASNRKRLDEQPTSVRDQKNRTGTAGSETESSQTSPKEGTPQEGTTDPRGRRQEAERKSGGQSQQETGAEQKQGGAEQKQGGTQQKQSSQEQSGAQPESSTKDGQAQPGQPKDGQPKDGQPQAGQSQTGQGEKGQGEKGQGQGKEGAKGQGQEGKGQEGKNGAGQEGKGNQSSPSGQPGNKPSPGMGQGGKGNSGGGFNNGEGPGEGAPLEESQANLDYAKKATDLVLNRLESQLKRGKIDKKIEEEMGWNKDQIRRFVERMRKEAQAAQDPNSPGSEARRLQFEETLKSLNFHPTAPRRSHQGPKNIDNEIGSQRSDPPAEYRALYEAYTKSLAKPIPQRSDDKK